MIDASDLCIVIPFRCDSTHRLENLGAAIQHLKKTVHSVELILIEDGPELMASSYVDDPYVTYIGQQNNNSFHKTVLLNKAFEEIATRPFVASFDADVLLYPKALEEALNCLRSGQAFISPFNGMFFDVKGDTRQELLTNPNLSDWPPEIVLAEEKPTEKKVVCINRNSPGGVVIFDIDAFNRAGGYNEIFKTWGFEDDEIVNRMAKFGFELAKVPNYPLLHLEHPRGKVSSKWYRSNRYNKALYKRLIAKSPAEIEQLVAEGGLRGAPPPPEGLLRRLGKLFGTKNT